MSIIPTPHNGACEGEVAKTVLMPGDPLRAKYIADHYLENVTCFNTVRNMLGYTGDYKGKQVSVMGGGMGIPSVGIYTYELYHFYNVDQIIRIGSAGALSDQVKVKDVVIAMGACTDSNYINQFQLPGNYAPIADYSLLERAIQTAKEKQIQTIVGNVVSSDSFYNQNQNSNDLWKKMNVLAVEMEAAGLYINAAEAGKKALAILTISDHIYTKESLSAEERQTSFHDMMEIALELA